MRAFLLILLVLVTLGVVGNGDFENDLIENEMYCDMVRDGHWPDYKNNYDEVCR